MHFTCFIVVIVLSDSPKAWYWAENRFTASTQCTRYWRN